MKSMSEHPFIKDAYPVCAQYHPGEKVEIEIELCIPAEFPEELMVVTDISALNRNISRQVETLSGKARGNCCVVVTADPCADLIGGFGVDIILYAGDRISDMLSTAYDVVRFWGDAPRYGFLCGFCKEDEEDCADVEQLRKYHIGALQFYDWMYRHHELIPPDDLFIDPLGRKLSLSAVRSKIMLCHAYGIKAMAYGAVYTASREFASSNPAMTLFRNDGEPETFGGGWLSIMDISEEAPWAKHIMNQFVRAIQELDFDGIHMDTYGYPKTAYTKVDGADHFVRLQRELPKLIDNVKAAICAVKPGACALFNAVGCWPAPEAARSSVIASYIEVWDPADRYIHLHDIVESMRQSGGKPVILAAYITAFQDEQQALAENALLLLQAVIFASGGYHIGLGEKNGVLCDPYFVEHAVIRDHFERTLRSWYDFIVRYSNLLYDVSLRDVSMTHAGGINEEYTFLDGAFSSYGEPGKVWTIVKEMPGVKIIHFINLTGIQSDRWNEGKPAPDPVRDIVARVLDNERAQAVWLASPDRNYCRMEPLPFEATATSRGRAVTFTVPELLYWNMVYIQTEY